MTPERRATWGSLALVAITAALFVAAVDLALGTVSKPHHLSEIEDAVREYEASDPDVIVLGSSHARSFEFANRELAERTGGRRSILSVPLEWGKLTGYEWVLEHRLRPLLEEKDEDGRLRRRSLKHFILVTEWWDSTVGEEPTWNLPSRAWTWRHFIADAAERGFDDYNRNYLTTRWLRTVRGSTLANDRGHGRILHDLKRRLVPEDPRAVEAALAFQTRKWRTMTEEGAAAIANPTEMAAMDRILDYFQDRDVDVHVVLYPRKPDTLTEKAKETTLRRFSETIARIGATRGVRVHDWTTGSPIGDEDFLADFDHVTEEGNVKLARWMLDGSFSTLADHATLVEDATFLEDRS